MTTQLRNVESWRTVGRRFQDLRNRIDDVGSTIQGEKGLTAPLVDAWIAVRNRFIHAMIGMEERFEAGCPADEWWMMLHGPNGTSCPPSSIRRRTNPILSRDEWIALGLEAKAIRDELSALIIAAGPVFGVTHRTIKRMNSADRALSRARLKLDDLRRKQHPDWADAPRLMEAPR